ncbi:chemotaxis protein CheW [Sorangium sp. So ce1151]|uniref:chemotaxis protein CheW n=1 Tax=Sorangium sp. So ce1151 TaxID=3133332 RepID=UPI003F6225FC
MRALVVRVRSWLCALPLGAVTETMRALDVRSLPGAPPFVRGLAVIRGAHVPVIDLAALLGVADGQRGARLVSVRAGERPLAIEVDEVLGIKSLDPAALERTPTLVSEALPACVDRLGRLDGQSLALLETARLLPEAVWYFLRGAA